MTMITPSYLGETIEYSSLHACRSTLEDPTEHFSDLEKAAVEQSVLQINNLDPDDYVMHLDLDEFHEYPAPLSEIVSLMNRRRAKAIRGWLVDRVADDGMLVPVRDGIGIGDQFPIGCDLTRELLRGWTQKIMLCRASVNLLDGANHTTRDASFAWVPVGRAEDFIVHHFKWVHGADVRLRARLESTTLGAEYKAECKRFLDAYYPLGRIYIDDPRLRARRLGPLRISGSQVVP